MSAVASARAFSTTGRALRRQGGQGAKSPKAANPVRSNAPERTMKNLVALHHSSASFMQSPDESDIGFDNAFKNTVREPYFMPYYRWRDSVLTSASVGAKSLIPRFNPLAGEDGGSYTRLPAATVWKTFKEHNDAWADRGPASVTERERLVKEALFGTWERGGLGMRQSQPGLDGVKEYLEAKGTTVDEYAKEWLERHSDGEETSQRQPQQKSVSKAAS